MWENRHLSCLKLYEPNLNTSDSIYHLSKCESEALHFLRALAFCCIFIGHIIQSFIPEVSGILVIGLQIFFLISGYIFGKAQINNWRDWGKKRFLRIYLPYAIFLLAVFLVYLCCGYRDLFSIKTVLGYLFMTQAITGYISGLFHLWFITVIVICYFLTPILQIIRRFNPFGLYVCLALLVIFHIYYHILAIYILLYCLSYFIASEIKANHIALSVLSVITILFVSLGNHIHFSDFTNHSILASAMKCASSVLLCIATIYIFDFKKIRSCGLIKQISNYSYEAYIVHPLLIFGPLSILSILPNFWAFGLSVSASTIILSVILNRASSYTLHLFHKSNTSQ